MTDIFMDAVSDSVKLLPFLFTAFCILEIFSHRSVPLRTDRLKRIRYAGPLLGALAGCIPQCGIPVLAIHLYSGSLITPGTLIAVMLSTSDEAVLVLLNEPAGQKAFLPLMLIRFTAGILAGYVTDLFLGRFFTAPDKIASHGHDDFCHRHGVILSALSHTAELFVYLFAFTLVLNVLLQTVGLKTLERLLLNGSVLQIFPAALIGLIPSCASALFLCELYLDGILGFASLAAGLCTSAGAGLLVLFRAHMKKKELFKLLLFLYGVAVTAGLVTALLGF